MTDNPPSPAQPESPIGQTSTRNVRHTFGPSFRIFTGPLTLEMPSEISKILIQLMNQTNYEPEELFFRSLLLYKAAVDAEEADKRIAIVDSADQVVQHITGL
jgi:hypothetical protein